MIGLYYNLMNINFVNASKMIQMKTPSKFNDKTSIDNSQNILDAFYVPW